MNLLWLSFIFYASSVQSAPAEDEITNLPGLSFPIDFKHYSGYLTSDNGIQLYYWFIESASNPSTDPVILWLNGGPGCSSLLGVFTELGPYRIQGDGETLEENIYSWNTFANVLFLDAPVCVGYSYDPEGNCVSDDDTTSMHSYTALKDFFTNKFPEYRENEFYITGESYAGMYVPTLTVRVVEGLDDFPLNIQGYAISNGITSWRISENANMFFGYYHGLFGDELWQRLVSKCCDGGIATKDNCSFYDPKDTDCAIVAEEGYNTIYDENLNSYNLYGKCDKYANTDQSFNYMAMAKGPTKENTLQYGASNGTKYRMFTPSDIPPCHNYTAMVKYANSAEFRLAAHVHEGLPDWDLCSANVQDKYTMVYESMKEQYEYLVPRVRGMLFSGDVDMACNFIGAQWFVESLNLEVLEDRRMWFVEDNLVGGFVKQLQNLDMLTVLGSGHTVPEIRPQATLKLITSFINKEPY